MKKFFAILLTLLLVVSLTAATADGVDINIIALKGPTSMGMVQFMDQVDQGIITDNQYSFSIVGAIDEVSPKLVQGSMDIAALPANLASVLYNNTNKEIMVLAVNTLGVIYIVQTGDIVTSVESLRGQIIYASGKGATPEYALNYILRGNGIDPETDVTIEWKSEHAECLAALMANDNGIAMLPQPFVATGQMKDERITIALDMTKEWDALQTQSDAPSAMITGVVVARKAFVQEHPEAVAAFMQHYAASVEFVNANMDEAAALIGAYGIVPEAVARKALPTCNIVFIAGEDMKTKLSGYLEALFAQNPKAVGGALPDDDFYYNK
ncbi:MAG TPA: ABC transporter substrate-binding protein [Candidatus Limiplasma sp.]|nr:ABC transporter substrate-binding protein [Candidatus Limiplasma sp.]HRX09658.1 ABC transporter substrate-binding protein [Candidatus Limiplasma sp.]